MKSKKLKNFEKDFILGTATSSYQVEGATAEDNRSPSIWDEFCKIHGKIYKGHTGDIACDHYHRYKEDIEIMKEIGTNAYRFSIAWPRIFPEKGRYNPKGMEFYKKLVYELNKKEIKPIVTLYHWELPMWAYNAGGWLNRDSINWFNEYAAKIFEELNDNVFLWITHNEPLCTSIYGHYEGFLAPGHKNLKEALKVAHHVLLSHGTVVEAFRKFGLKSNGIGISLNLNPSYPASNSEEDKKAAHISSGYDFRWFLDPLFKSSYPEDMKIIYKDLIGDFDFVKDGDIQKISIDNDFLGINYYTRKLVKFSQNSKLKFKKIDGSLMKTEMNWEIIPESLCDVVSIVRKEYTKIPIYITENGIALDDKISKDGKVHDNTRIDYLREHLIKVSELNQKGSDIRGYFIWSLIDNFEWHYGYSKRFGIVFTDYESQKRILKDSALWYKDLIKTRIIK